jgi:hypothetical protein
MQAPSLDALYDIETGFETAAQTLMTVAGVTAMISLANADISNVNAKAPLINTGIGFDLGPAIDVKAQIPAPSNWPADTPPPQEYFRYVGNLEFRVQVPQDMNTTNPPVDVDTIVAGIRSRIRVAMMLCCLPFPESALPYYVVSDIRPNGTTTAWDQPRNEILLVLRFAITFAIRPDAWPEWDVTP